MQHVDTDMFLTENAAIFPGIVTTNDLYNMISIEEMFVPLAHGVHGDQVLKLIDEFAIGNDTDTVATMVGSIVGALHGIEALPSHYLSVLNEANKFKLEDLAARILQLHNLDNVTNNFIPTITVQ